jgi:hypothetical protein
MVITDGEASDKGPLEKVLVDASHNIARDECLAISFIQVGQDKGARRFLKMLDDDLTGCKVDIVGTKACHYCHTTSPHTASEVPNVRLLSPELRRGGSDWAHRDSAAGHHRLTSGRHRHKMG